MLFKLVLLGAIVVASTETRVFECQRIYYGGDPESPVHEARENVDVKIWNFTLEVEYDTNQVDVREDEETGMANILANGIAIHFKGYIASSSRYPPSPSFMPYHLQGPITTRTIIKGRGRVLEKTINSQNYKSLSDCKLDLGIPKSDYGNVSGYVLAGIRFLATDCINLEAFCDNFYYTKPENSEAISRLIAPQKMITQDEMLSTNNVDYNSGYMGRWTSIGKSELNILKKIKLQSTINILVDLAIAEIVKKIKEESNGVIKIPDIKERFSESHSWTLSGEFDATNGLFSDLTTLSRNGDANLSHDGLKFIATCGFGLTEAHMTYEKYKLKYGISVSGRLMADVDGVAISISTVVDYSQNPCRVVLQELRVTKMGELHVHLTGVRPLNNLVSRLITWITNKWEGDIVHIIENQIKGIVQEHLDTFDCERFRP